ncbi:response regulator [bacterium AH-315-P13]|nr:response regulator [bacterium AH-315-P13]
MKKLNILLVEDDRATNFLNKYIIKKKSITKHIQVSENGLEALEFLKLGIKDNNLLPDLIFLDINMPILNGWEFLNEYKKLEIAHKEDIVIMMLTSSINPDDKKKAEAIKEVKGFLGKPLTPFNIHNIIQEYFIKNI